MPGGRSGEKRSADVIGAAMCGPRRALGLRTGFSGTPSPAPSSVLGPQFERLPGANDKRLLKSFLNVKDKLPVARNNSIHVGDAR
jgi:hypothetical protein